MCVSEILVWLYDDDGKKFHLSHSRHQSKSEMSINKNDPLIKYLEEKPDPFPVNLNKASDHRAIEFLTQNQKFLNRCGVSTISPLIAKDEFIGFLGLGEEVTGATYNYEDYDILKTMCHQAYISLFRKRDFSFFSYSANG